MSESVVLRSFMNVINQPTNQPTNQQLDHLTNRYDVRRKKAKDSALHAIIILHSASGCGGTNAFKGFENNYHHFLTLKNAKQNASGPVGPAVKKSSGPDSKNAGLGPAGPL